MKPSDKTPGVLFSPHELPGYMHVLEGIVRYPDRSEAGERDAELCSMVLSGIKQSLRFRRDQHTFMPASASMAISKRLQDQSSELTGFAANGLHPLFFMFADPVQRSADLEAAAAIEKAVIESHNLNR